MQIYVVKPGDSLYSIAKMFGISLHMIMETNGLERPNDLVVGQAILILTPEITHTIRPGETIEYIAAQHNKSVNQIYRNNPYLNARPSLVAGDELVISYTDKPTTQISVNGFLYPNINHELLTNTLPFLTYISPFTYSFSFDGNLTPLRDEFILRRAYEYGVRPLMTLSSIDDDGRFSPELSDSLLNNVEMQQKLMGQVLNTLQTRQYSGVVVDFERILPQNRDIYTNFIRNIHKFLNDNGYILYVAVAPKISAEQLGALYTAHDYEGLGEASDGVIIMTYEWGYIYSQPMAVAPIQKVEKVVPVVGVDGLRILLYKKVRIDVDNRCIGVICLDFQADGMGKMGFSQSSVREDEEGVVGGGTDGGLRDHLAGEACELVTFTLDEVVEVERLDKVARHVAHLESRDDVGIGEADRFAIRVVDELLRRVLGLNGRVGWQREGDVLLLVGLFAHRDGVHQLSVVAKLFLHHGLQETLRVLLQPFIKRIGRQTDGQNPIFQ